MMRRSFQLSGSYDVIKDVTDLESKCVRVFFFSTIIPVIFEKEYISWWWQINRAAFDSSAEYQLRTCEVFEGISVCFYLST